MSFSTRLLLAASLCLAPLGWAAAQDQQHDDQHQRERQEKEQHQQQQRPAQQPQSNQQQQHAAPQQGNTAPQGKGAGPSGQQFQRPAQNNAAPPNAQSFERPAPNNVVRPSPPTGATASPTPPPTQNQFQRVQQGAPQNGAVAPTAPAQQQQFQQRSVQRGGAPTGAVAPQTQLQQQQPTTTSRNFQGTTRTNTAAFAQRHAGAAPTQFNRGLFYGHDYAHFTTHESALWRRGAWRREFHDGRFGYWFVVDGIWYFYDQPIYPYPTFVPEIVYIPEEDYEPPVYVDAPPEAPPAPYGQPATYYYYFCQDTQTYYPYVTSCASPWQPVPATPQ